MEFKKYFANGNASFINGPALLLNDKPKNTPDWNILDIWPRDNLISFVILFSNAFFGLVFCLVVNNDSRGKLFH